MDHKKKGRIGGFLIYAITRPLAIMPLSWHRTLGRFIGWLVGDVLGYRRDVVVTNISRAFPEKKYDEITDITRRFYRHFGRIFTEALWFGAHSSHKALSNSHIVEIRNVEVFNRLYDKDKSIFVMSSHNGNWEIYGGYISYCYKEPIKFEQNDICVIFKQQHSATANHFLAKNRTAPIIEKEH